MIGSFGTFAVILNPCGWRVSVKVRQPKAAIHRSTEKVMYTGTVIAGSDRITGWTIVYRAVGCTPRLLFCCDGETGGWLFREWASAVCPLASV